MTKSRTKDEQIKSYNELLKNNDIHYIQNNENTIFNCSQDELNKRLKSLSNALAIPNCPVNCQGYRQDIDLICFSSTEANIYRVMQKYGYRYKREEENIFLIKLPDNRERAYRVDLLDIDGLFGIPGAYIEIKGYMDEDSKNRILAFREQYPQYKLLIVGYNTNGSDLKPDIDYLEFEKKYKDEFELWETKTQSISQTPWLYDINYTITCPFCNKRFTTKDFILHCIESDIEHENLLRRIIASFFELRFAIDNEHDRNLFQLECFTGNQLRQLYDYLIPFEFRKLRKIYRGKFNSAFHKIQKRKTYICPICGKSITTIHRHLYTAKDEKHKEFYDKQIELTKQLFQTDVATDEEVNEKGVIWSFKTCKEIWDKYFSKEDCQQRGYRLIVVTREKNGNKRTFKHSENGNDTNSILTDKIELQKLNSITDYQFSTYLYTFIHFHKELFKILFQKNFPNIYSEELFNKYTLNNYLPSKTDNYANNFEIFSWTLFNKLYMSNFNEKFILEQIINIHKLFTIESYSFNQSPQEYNIYFDIAYIYHIYYNILSQEERNNFEKISSNYTCKKSIEKRDKTLNRTKHKWPVVHCPICNIDITQLYRHLHGCKYKHDEHLQFYADQCKLAINLFWDDDFNGHTDLVKKFGLLLTFDAAYKICVQSGKFSQEDIKKRLARQKHLAMQKVIALGGGNKKKK